jgi:hypothetical protein
VRAGRNKNQLKILPGKTGGKRPYLRNGPLMLIAPGPAALSGIQVLLPHPQPNM